MLPSSEAASRATGAETLPAVIVGQLFDHIPRCEQEVIGDLSCVREDETLHKCNTRGEEK